MIRPRLALAPLAVLLLSLTAVAPLAAQSRDSATSNCDVAPTALTMDSEELAALAQINAYRIANGAPPLAPSATLTRAAAWKSASMAGGTPFGHDDAFRSWSQRLADCGYPDGSYSAAENIAAGEQTGAGTVNDWEHSPEHNINLLNPVYTAAGLKRAHSSNPRDPYGWYWTLDLGGGLDVPLGGQ